MFYDPLDVQTVRRNAKALRGVLYAQHGAHTFIKEQLQKERARKEKEEIWA
jgi:hypothetical protein